MKAISLILAVDKNYGIGKDGKIPWKSKKDMAQFKEITTGHTVIMGRKTWDSLPEKHRPLSNRRNIVITSKMENMICDEYDAIYTNIEDAVKYETIISIQNEKHPKVFIIGGASLYNYCLDHPLLKEIYLTTINVDYDCDIFVDKTNLNNIIKWDEDENGDSSISVRHSLLYYDQNEYSCKYTIKHCGEDKYIKLAHKILLVGDKRKTRNAEVISLFGERLEFDLRNGFPLLTTKKMFWRGIVEELLWFLRGDTNVKHLQEKGVHIWDGNTTRQFLDDNGLTHLKECDGGAIYSHQWRHFNAKYVDCETDYMDKGYDQIADCIKQIRTNPTSRRIMFSAWNPSQFKDMSLLPCHVSYQFYVDTEYNELSCMMTQRSADMFLGLPFNIASTALLTCLIAYHCDLKPHRIIINLGDVHIYDTHRMAMYTQIKNTQYGFPKLKIKCKKENIEEYKFEDIELTQYYSNPMIKAEMIA